MSQEPTERQFSRTLEKLKTTNDLEKDGRKHQNIVCS